MSLMIDAALAFSILVAIQAGYTVYLMIYTWDQPEAYAAAAAPATFAPPALTFTVLLPARHEEEVIQQTIQRVASASYPADKVEIIVICEAGDTGTIARAATAIEELTRRGRTNARVVTFNDRPINKPHGLNVGFARSCGEVITIFDAEDEIHPDIFNIVNTVMLREQVRAVQCGVQLMDYDSSWYSTLNVLEYYFWFKSRLHFHAAAGMIPLGGNTVFFRRELVEELGGWDERNLTEDADVGIRLSAMGERVRVVYDDRYVTREETPPTLGHFIRQRTRWSQGFLQTLMKGEWRKLRRWDQKLLAVYTLAFPVFQVALALYLPVSLWMMLTVRTSVVVAMLLLLPSYFLLAHYFISVIGLYEFCQAHGLHPPATAPLTMAAVYLPYQWVLAYAAVRAMVRQLFGASNWEKTKHTGAHRIDQPPDRGAEEHINV